MAQLAEETPPSEAVNHLTTGLDAFDAVKFTRALRSADASIFAGYKSHEGLMDNRQLDAAETYAQVMAQAIRRGGPVVFTGCGTSGRIAYLTARRFNRLSAFPPASQLPVFDYLISGGDSALVLSDELPEDDAALGASELKAVATGRQAMCLIGVTCGLSAAYVAGQLDYVLNEIGTPASTSTTRPELSAAVLGFNPARLARTAPIAKLRSGAANFRQLVAQMSFAAASGAPVAVLDPVVGPEPIAGSSRMHGGSATLALLDAMCFRAACLIASDNAGAAALLPSARPEAPATMYSLLSRCEAAARAAYQDPESLAAVAELAARATRSTGRLFYLGDGVAGIVGIVDASEMPDTYGVPFDTVRAFVGGGWTNVGMSNREGEGVRGKSPLLHLSLEDFETEVLPTISSDDTAILLGCGEQPPVSEPAPGPSVDAGEGSKSVADGTWALARLAQLMRTRGIGRMGLVCAGRPEFVAGMAGALAGASLDAHCLVHLEDAGFVPGHTGLSELALKICLNAVSTYAMTARGLVFSNRMIATGPTNDKIYHRCLKMIAEMTGVADDAAKQALLRAVHETDTLSAELLAAPAVVHIQAATPKSAEQQLSQQLVLPLAMLLASSDAHTIASAKAALRREPRVSRLIHEMQTGGAAQQAASADPVPSADPVASADLGPSAPSPSGAMTTTSLDHYVIGLGRQRQPAREVRNDRRSESRISHSTMYGRTHRRVILTDGNSFADSSQYKNYKPIRDSRKGYCIVSLSVFVKPYTQYRCTIYKGRRGGGGSSIENTLCTRGRVDDLLVA